MLFIFVHKSLRSVCSSRQVVQMPEPERENVDPKQNKIALEQKKTCVKDQRAVAWQDGVDGKSLFTVGF